MTVTSTQFECVTEGHHGWGALFFALFRTVKVLRVVVMLLFKYVAARISGKKVSETLPVLVRDSLMDIGGAFVKFGQMMAMRPDLLPEPFCNELLELLDDEPRFPTPIALQIVRSELGRPLKEIFSRFDSEPIAAASFGQVYRAELVDGTSVAVKVQRPNIRRLVKIDLKLLRILIWLMQRRTSIALLRLDRVLDEFRIWTGEELNYIKEACYCQKIHDASKNASQNIPNIYWECTTERVLVMDFIGGLSMKDLLKYLRNVNIKKITLPPGFCAKKVGRNILRNFLEQVFDIGVFHADPHAGNLVVQENSVIGYVDFGITGVMDQTLRRRNLGFARALAQEDIDLAYTHFKEILAPPDYADLSRLEKGIKQNLSDWLLLQSRKGGVIEDRDWLRDRSIARLIGRNLELVRACKLPLPNVVVRYYRALMMIDLLVLELEPDIDLRKELLVYIRRSRARAAAARRNVSRRIDWLFETGMLIDELPQRARQILESASGLTAVYETQVQGGISLIRRTGFLILKAGRRASAVVCLVSVMVVLLGELFRNWASTQFMPYLLDLGACGGNAGEGSFSCGLLKELDWFAGLAGHHGFLLAAAAAFVMWLVLRNLYRFLAYLDPHS